MPDRKIRLAVLAAFVLAALIGATLYLRGGEARLPIEAVMGPRPTIADPVRRFTPTLGLPEAVGWSEGAKPVPAEGLAVQAFARDLDHPRWLLALPNGDVLVAEARAPESEERGLKELVTGLVMNRVGAGGVSADRITLLRDADGDGVAETRSVLISGIKSPVGMALVGEHLYVAATDALLRYDFKPGQTKITVKPKKILNLPTGGHWTRTLVASADGSKLYVGVGSYSDHAEEGIDIEVNRAAVLEVDPKTGDYRIWAAGLRNPVGLDWEPTTGTLWGVVNERDGLGSDLPPDYLTQVQFGGFYGWPYYYWGGYTDPRIDPPEVDMRQYSIRPDYALGAHVAPIGLAFAGKAALGPRFAEGAFVALHGSWNRRPVAGYKLIFVPFANGRPKGMPRDVLGGFLDGDGDARGRPAGLAIDGTGALLVADDAGNTVWRVVPKR